MPGRRCMARQNGCQSHSSAIFVYMGAVLLLYGPHIARAEDATCEDLRKILVIPNEVQCVQNPPALIYNNIFQDQAVGPMFTLTALEGVTFTAVDSQGLPDVGFDTYYKGALDDSKTISWNISASLEDVGDYSAEGETQQKYSSSQYNLNYTNDNGDLQVLIDRFEFWVRDINNKAPEFENTEYSTSLREDWLLDLDIPELTVKVRDLDYTNEPDLQLSFDEGCPLDPVGSQVSIAEEHYSAMTFKLKAKLDYEANPIVTCTLTADDTVNKGTTQIVINITPGQDKPPEFEHFFYKIQVTGNESPGDIMPVDPEAIHADDKDNPPTNITYTMEDAENDIVGTSYFEIIPDTGDIKLIKVLDEDFLNDYSQLHFVIFATDEVGDQDKAFLEINLPGPSTSTEPTTSTTTTDSGSTTTTPSGMTTPTTPSVMTSTSTATSSGTTTATTTHEPSGPVFLKDTYLFQKLKTMTDMGTVKATIEGQVSDEIEYTLEDNLDGTFTIDPKSGNIKRQTDIEEGIYNLTVFADANGRTGDTLVHISVYDDLDQSLSIEMSLNQVTVPEEDAGAQIGVVKNLGDKTAYPCVLHQEGQPDYNAISFEFNDNDDNILKLKEGKVLDREEVKEMRVWVQIFPSETDCSSYYLESSPRELLRSQSLFIIEVEDKNDHNPIFDYPEGDSITVAYPEDPALQKVVGPVIQFKASDEDDSDYVRYKLENNDKFVVDSVSGEVFWEGKDSLGDTCVGNGCSFIVKAEDQDSNFSNPISCNVVSLPQNNIYTLSFPDLPLSSVEDKMDELSSETDMTVKALYVTPKLPEAETTKGRARTKYMRTKNDIRDDLVGTPFNLDVHVSVLKNGEIVTLNDFNNALVDNKEAEAEDFRDKEVFHIEEDSSKDDLGLQIALGVTGGLLGIILLGLVIMGLIRCKKRSEKRRGPEVPDLRRSYGNQGYASDYGNGDIKQHDTLDGNSMKMNGFHEPPRAGRDSPPLNKSVLAPAPESPHSYQGGGGLRRTAPENVPNIGQPASREPPAQFKDSNTEPPHLQQQPPKQQQPPPLAAPAAVAPAAVAAPAVVTAAATQAKTTGKSDADQTPAAGPTPLIQGSSPYNNTSSNSNQTRQKKEPPPLTAAPKKSALKGYGGTTSTAASQKTKEPQIPLSSMAPAEPTADYDSSPAKIATSSFSNLKASPPPKKKEVEQTKQENDDNEDDEDISTDRKKSNLKAATDSESNVQDKKKEQNRKSSVAFKVLVEEKTIEAQNEGPAAKKQAENEAKAEANQAAVDIMEANKKKLKDDDDDDEDGISKL